MSYRPRPEFDQPTAESVQRSRRAIIWLLPLIILQQGATIFRHGSDVSDRLLATVSWVAVSIAILWMLLGLPLRWLPERDQAILNDEWSRSVSGEASRWGLAAMVGLGCSIIIARMWIQLDTGVSIYGLVNGALVVATIRFAWLNRDVPDEDD